jgi:hypothetical protein
MSALMAISAFVIDFGYLAFVQRQAQDLADAAATAAAKEYDPQFNGAGATPLQGRIMAAAQRFVNQNLAWGFSDPTTPAAIAPVTLVASTTEPAAGSADDVAIVGSWVFGARPDESTLARCATSTRFTPLATGIDPTTSNSNAVRVRVMLESLPLFFARWLGIATSDVCAAAIAVWTGLGVSPPDNTVPLAFPMCIFPDTNGDGVPEPFYGRTVRAPDPSDNTGWTGLGYNAGSDDPNANANVIRQMLDNNPDYEEYKRVAVGDPIYLVNGDITSVWNFMRTDPRYAPGTRHVIPVIDRDCSDPYNQVAIVVAFAYFEIRAYGGPPAFPGQHFIEGVITLCAPDDMSCQPFGTLPGGGPCLGIGCRSGLQH